MPHFETFKKSSVALSKQPRVTIQKRGTITINAAAYASLGEPEAVELLYDRSAQILGLRAVAAGEAHAAFVRPTSRRGRGPWVISAMAFVNHYGIDISVARRWNATVDGGALCVSMAEPGTDVSKPAPKPAPERGARSRARSNQRSKEPGRA